MADSSTLYSRSPKALYIAAGLSGAVAFADFLFGAVYVTLLLGRAISPSLLGTMSRSAPVCPSCSRLPAGHWQTDTDTGGCSA